MAHHAVVQRHGLGIEHGVDGPLGVDAWFFHRRLPAALVEEPRHVARRGVGLQAVAERLDERGPHAGQRDAVLRSLGSGDRGHDGRQVQLEHLAEHGLGVAVAAEQPLLLRVALDEVDAVLASRETQVLQRHVVDGEERRRRPVLGAHVGKGGAVGELEGRQAVAEELDELADDPVRAEHLGEREDEIGRRGAGGERADDAHADDDGDGQEHRLPEHRRLGLDATDAPGEDPQAVDHRRVRVRPDERVRHREAVLHRDHLAEMLEVHLMADPGPRRDHAHPVERLLGPAQQRVPLAVAPVLPLDVRLVRGRRPEEVHLNRVVDHEVHVDERIHLRRVAAGTSHRGAHRGEVDHRGHAGEVLHQHAGGHERDVRPRDRGRPLRE